MLFTALYVRLCPKKEMAQAYALILYLEVFPPVENPETVNLNHRTDTVTAGFVSSLWFSANDVVGLAHVRDDFFNRPLNNWIDWLRIVDRDCSVQSDLFTTTKNAGNDHCSNWEVNALGRSLHQLFHQTHRSYSDAETVHISGWRHVLLFLFYRDIARLESYGFYSNRLEFPCQFHRSFPENQDKYFLSLKWL